MRISKQRANRPYREQARLHPPALLAITLQPAFRPPEPGIFAVNSLVAVHHPRTHPDDDPTFKPLPAHGRALGGDDAFEREAEGRVQAAGFLDTGVKIGECARLFECPGVGRGREGGDFGEEAGEGARVREEAVDGGAEEDGGGVTAGGDVGGCPCCEGPR